MSLLHEHIEGKKLFALNSIYPSKFDERDKAIEFIESVWSTHKTVHPFHDSMTSNKYGVWLCNELLKLGKREVDEQSTQDIHLIYLWAQSSSPNITSMSLSEATKKAMSWNKGKILPPMIDHERIMVRDDSGYFLYDLRKEDFKYEGNMMGHCVSGYDKKYNFNSNILVSLRDKFNKPHATFESIIDNENSSIIQQFGNSNKPLSKDKLIIITDLISKYFLK